MVAKVTADGHFDGTTVSLNLSIGLRIRSRCKRVEDVHNATNVLEELCSIDFSVHGM